MHFFSSIMRLVVVSVEFYGYILVVILV